MNADQDRNTNARKDATNDAREDSSKSQRDSRGLREGVEDTQPVGAQTPPATQPSQQEENEATPDAELRFGRYSVVQTLGKGSFGMVYLARDALLDRLVAVKVPTKRWSESERDEFLAEAKRLAQLQHPGIVGIHDIGEQDGRCFLVTDFVEGHTLRQQLKQRRYDWREAVEVVAQLADALEHAHARSMIHRDIKPGNVMIASDGRPVLLDFGLAITDWEGTGDADWVAGTPAYMSPEQTLGKAHRVDGRTDIYSLGTVLYEMLGGRVPFRARANRELFRKIQDDEPQPVRQLNPQVPDALERVCRRAMAKRQSDRFTTAGDFARALRQIISAPATATVEPPEDVERTVSYVRDVDAETRARTSDGSQLSSRRRREAQRRQLTLCQFNFEAVPVDEDEPLDAELQHELAEEFQSLCAEAVTEFGGHVLPASGQSIGACFGFPTAYEDAAQRAVLAALKLRDATSVWNQRLHGSHDCCVDIWSVVHTGEVIAEEKGDAEHTSIFVTGDAANIVAKLEPLVPVGQATITDATRRLVAGLFEITPAGSQSLRGMDQPLELHLVQKAVVMRNRVERMGAGHVTPLVGRDTELSVLKDRWEQSLEGLGQVVLLIGDAGLGKTRLIHEIRRHVTQYSDDASAVVAELRCSPHHQNTSYYPVTEYLLQLLEFEQHPTAAERLGRIRRYLQELGLDEPEHVALLATLLSVPLDRGAADLQLTPKRLKENTELLLLEILKRRAEQSPVLFVVEDLHWVDPTTTELLTRYLESFESGRVLSIFTFRPDFRTPWQSYPYQTQIALNRLTKRQIGEMMRRQTGQPDLPDDLIRQVVERTEGVPLFIEEFTNLICESDLLAGDQDATESVLQKVIPATLKDLLVARLDRMDSNPDVVQMAATIGREFSYRLLSATIDVPEEELQMELSKLVGAEMLFQKGRVPDATYIFKHALIQDSAYQSLLKKKRHLFHRRTAEVLEARFPDVAEMEPELLAFHFTEADQVDKAIEYWRKAGQRCQAQSANSEAIHHYHRGLEQVANLPESPQRDGLELSLQLPLGVSLLAAKGYANAGAGAVLDRALELGERAADPATLFYIQWGSWARHLVRSDLNICREYIPRILDHAERQADDSWVCEAHFVPEVVDFYAGDFTASCRHAEQAVARFDPESCTVHAQGTGQDVRSGVLSFHGMSLWPLGRVDYALRRAREAIAISRTLNHPMSLGFAFHHGGWVLLFARLWDELLSVAEECYRLSREQGLALWEASALYHRGLCYLHLGQIDTALEHMHQGCEQFAGTGARCAMPLYLTMLGEGYRQAGDFNEALAWIERSCQWARDTDDQNFYLAETHRVKGDILLAQNESDAAAVEACYRQAAEIAQAQSALSFELRAAMSLVRLAQQTGDSIPAWRQLQQVYGRYQEGFDTADLIEARQLLDKTSTG